MTKEEYMKLAIQEAKKAAKKDEVPIGCIIVCNDQVIAKGHNQRESKQLTKNPAEMIAIEQANKKLGFWRLEECELYVTLEPCMMCMGAIYQSRIKKVYFGAYDAKGGICNSLIDFSQIKGLNHYPSIEGGILKDECSNLLKEYFREKRKMQKSKTLPKE